MTTPGKGVKDFLGKAAPPGYIAGLGRGATGFVTRPDLGPGSSIASQSAVSAKPSATNATRENDKEDFNDNENEEGLLAAKGPLAAEDEEADAVFAMIEAKMSERRKKSTTTTSAAARKRASDGAAKDDPTTLFAKERLQLRQVSAAEWAKLPESGDFIAKRVKKENEKERYTPVPDSVLLGNAFGFSNFATSQDSSAVGGAETDFRSVGEAKERVLGNRLDMTAVDNGKGTSTVDPIGYLTSLEDARSANTDINDIKRARSLLKHVVHSNPQNASAWISAAKIEEVGRNLKQARLLIDQAIENCPDNEDVWTEAIRLAPDSSSKITFASKATRTNPQSIKLWLTAANLYEKDAGTAKKILRDGLEENSGSSTLWKALIEREEDREDARILLAKAVECCPYDTELWIALARLETHLDARRVLNKARQVNPMSMEVWMAAARLEDANGNYELVDKIISRAVPELEQRGVLINRADWIKEAETCEEAGDIHCAKSVIWTSRFLGLDQENDDLRAIWLDNAKTCRETGHHVVAKELLQVALKEFPLDETLWLRVIEINPTQESFEQALQACASCEGIWLKYVQFVPTELRSATLEQALKVLSSSEQLWLVYGKLLVEQDDIKGALRVFERAIEIISSEMIWYKLVKLSILSDQNNQGNAKLVQRAIDMFPKSERLWLLKVKLCAADKGEFDWNAALQACPKSANLYIFISDWHLSIGNAMQARAILEKARKLIPNDDKIWLSSIKLEINQNSIVQGRNIQSRALKACPDSTLLWVQAINMESRPTRKAKIMEALRQCGNDPLILVALAQLLESERNLVNASEYYERALAAGQNVGDVWAWYMIFLTKYGHEFGNKLEELNSKLLIVKPKDGFLWRSFCKQDCWWKRDFSIIFDAFIKYLLELK